MADEKPEVLQRNERLAHDVAFLADSTMELLAKAAIRGDVRYPSSNPDIMRAVEELHGLVLDDIRTRHLEAFLRK